MQFLACHCTMLHLLQMKTSPLCASTPAKFQTRSHRVGFGDPFGGNRRRGGGVGKNQPPAQCPPKIQTIRAKPSQWHSSPRQGCGTSLRGVSSPTLPDDSGYCFRDLGRPRVEHQRDGHPMRESLRTTISDAPPRREMCAGTTKTVVVVVVVACEVLCWRAREAHACPVHHHAHPVHQPRCYR